MELPGKEKKPIRKVLSLGGSEGATDNRDKRENILKKRTSE